MRGEPGIGKSRLVAEVLATTCRRRATTMTILCTEYEQSNDLGAAGGAAATRPGWSPRCSVPRNGCTSSSAICTELGLDPDQHTGLLAPLLGLDPSVGYAPGPPPI